MSDRQQATSNGEYNNAGQNSGKQTEEKKCVCKTVIDNLDSGKRHMARLCRYVIEGIGSPWPEESWKTFVLWILSIIIDPLVLYVPRINDEKKLLDFDRSFLLILSILYFVVHICMFMIYCCTCKKSYPKLWWIFIVGAPLVPVLANGSLQLLLIFKSRQRIRASLFSFGMGFFLILYLVRVLGIYRLFIATALRESTVLRILINLILYLYGGHLFGGLWYFFAIWKKMQCWNIACINHGECYYANHRFNIISGDNKFLNDICFNTIKYTTYELGIFKDALESRIVEEKSLMKKLLYCLTWGTQNVSAYGQNLAVSTHAWENIFVILVAIYGMTTFAFFIGNMQDITKSDQKARWTQKDLEEWPPFRKFSKKLQKVILDICWKHNWPQTGVVNVKTLLSNLPKEDEDNIKRTFCLELPIKGWNGASLDDIYKYIKPVVYAERTHIVNEGDPITEMYFVLEGDLWTYSSRKSTNDVSQDSNLLTYGDFWGAELVSWAQNEPSLSNIPRSNRTVQALTKVEAFALMVVDLKNIFNQRPQDIPIEEGCKA